MQKILLLLSLSVFLMVSNMAFAKMVPLEKWNSTTGSRINDSKDISRCSKQCSGYSTTTTYCLALDEVIEICSVSGCEHYRRCVKK